MPTTNPRPLELLRAHRYTPRLVKATVDLGRRTITVHQAGRRTVCLRFDNRAELKAWEAKWLELRTQLIPPPTIKVLSAQELAAAATRTVAQMDANVWAELPAATKDWVLAQCESAANDSELAQVLRAKLGDLVKVPAEPTTT
jgi:hypothetical protein